jgi:hypothetical protein
VNSLPRKLPLRLLVVGALVLGAAWALPDRLLATLIPAIRAEIRLVQPAIDIVSLQLAQRDGTHSLALRADLAYPVYVGDVAIRPLGWNRSGHGYFEISTSTRGLLLAPAILLIGLLAWPAAGWREMAVRLLVALPMLAVLVALDVPLDLAGTFQHAVIHHAGLDPPLALFAWAQFLEGGGNVAIALAMAVTAIALAGKMNLAGARAG